MNGFRTSVREINADRFDGIDHLHQGMGLHHDQLSIRAQSRGSGPHPCTDIGYPVEDPIGGEYHIESCCQIVGQSLRVRNPEYGRTSRLIGQFSRYIDRGDRVIETGSRSTQASPGDGVQAYMALQVEKLEPGYVPDRICHFTAFTFIKT